MVTAHNHLSADPFVRFNKKIVMDSSISAKAKFILLYAFSKPIKWQFYINEIAKHSTDGTYAIKSGLKELELAGYLHRKPRRNSESGRMEGWDWSFHDEPISSDEFQKMFPKDGFSDDRKNPISEIPTAIKNDLYTKNEEELFVADAPVGALPSKILVKGLVEEKAELTKSDVYWLAQKGRHHNWTVADIDYAWEVIATYKGVIHDWQAFIAGTIENRLKAQKSLKACKQKARSDEGASQNNRKLKGELCNSTVQHTQKTCKKDYSDQGTEEQPSQKSLSLRPILGWPSST